MRAPTLLVLVAWLAGCANAAVVASSGGSAGATTAGASVTAVGQPSPLAWALLAVYLVGAAQSSSGLDAGERSPPPLDARRQVNEVDCTRPIADWSANLHCK